MCVCHITPTSKENCATLILSRRMLWKPKFMKVFFNLFLCSYDFLWTVAFFLDLLKIKLSFYLLQKLPLQVTAWRFVSDPGRCNLYSSSFPFPSQLAHCPRVWRQMCVKVLIGAVQGCIASGGQATGLLAALLDMSHHLLWFTIVPPFPLWVHLPFKGTIWLSLLQMIDNLKDTSSVSGGVLFCPSWNNHWLV